MRFAVDTGGTFTDLIVDEGLGTQRMFKAPTTPDDPVRGVLDSLQLAADEFGLSRTELLSRGETFIHGTTHAINAIITGRTGRTAFVTSQGHPDVLLLREGGRADPFDFTVPFPDPYIPRSLTFEIPGRMHADGSESEPFDEAAALTVLERLREAQVEAVAVCLLWSIVNPQHEIRFGQLLAEHLPSVPFTLSHRLNPVIREFRRASSTAIDASLKPLMSRYLRNLEQRLREAGFAGRVLVVTSQAGVMDAADAAEAPIHIVNSGPSMAPVAGRWFARADEGAETAIVADTGGTTYDVSLVRGGRIPVTRDTWIGPAYRGVMVGFPWVDVKSVGAGGGSLAWVDRGGLLHVGPQSAGAVPGPAAYGRGGTRPTVTDACLVLGYLDPDFFLGGAMRLNTEAARRAIDEHVARPLRIDTTAAAAAIVALATENMVQAIVEITVNQGIDPRDAILVGGGGAAGLNSVQIARRLGCRRLLIPEVGAALSAAGALMSELRASYHTAAFATTAAFEYERINRMLAGLEAQCRQFAENAGGARSVSITYVAEARYATQAWEIEVPVWRVPFADAGDLEAFVNGFHETHRNLFTFEDPSSPIEITGWTARVACRLGEETALRLGNAHTAAPARQECEAYFPGAGWVTTRVRRFDELTSVPLEGPAIVESPFTTIVIDPGANVVRRGSGSLSIDVGAADDIKAREVA